MVPQAPGACFAHSLPIWAGALLLFLPARRLGVLGYRVLVSTPRTGWGGVLLVFLGLSFTVWARAHLGRFWSSSVTLKSEHALVRTGPYAISRHPIYTGLLLALLGSALARGTIGALVSLALFVWGFMIKIRQEERLLLAHFGAAYRAYQAHVPTLIPRPWKA